VVVEGLRTFHEPLLRVIAVNLSKNMMILNLHLTDNALVNILVPKGRSNHRCIRKFRGRCSH
jgi:hypothetical protein